MNDSGSDGDGSTFPGNKNLDPDKSAKKQEGKKKNPKKDDQPFDEEISHEEADDSERDNSLEKSYGPLFDL